MGREDSERRKKIREVLYGILLESLSEGLMGERNI
jgi:hypothetical protein